MDFHVETSNRAAQILILDACPNLSVTFKSFYFLSFLIQSILSRCESCSSVMPTLDNTLLCHVPQNFEFASLGILILISNRSEIQAVLSLKCDRLKFQWFCNTVDI